MAGINRLGKAAPRPGSLRPPDPNKYRTMDMFSEDTDNDKDYQKMVQDIEDAQQSQVGWLFGRGAFDKADLLYLRDEEEKMRFKEDELRDSERSEFHKLKAKADLDPGKPVSAPRPLKRDKPAPSKPQAKVIPTLVRVKAADQKIKVLKPAQSPESKRPRLTEDSALPTMSSPEKPSSAAPQNDGDDGGGLAGLLGAYGSDDDSDEEQDRT